MTITGWLQIALVLSAVVAAAWPLGLYMARVFRGEKTILSPILVPVERAVYAAANVDPKREQTWLGYALAMLAINGLDFLLLYGLMRFQHLLPLNPQ
jgi:K+-transporting ATPase ATPase A chain